MDGISFTQLISLISVMGVICSILGFLIGRKKDNIQVGQKEGLVSADILYIKNAINDLKNSVDRMDNKIDSNQEKLSKEYRDLLILVTKIDGKFNDHEKRLSILEETIRGEH